MMFGRFALVCVVLIAAVGSLLALQHAGQVAVRAEGIEEDPFGAQGTAKTEVGDTDPFGNKAAESPETAAANPFGGTGGQTSAAKSETVQPAQAESKPPTQAESRPWAKDPPIRSGEEAIEQVLEETTLLEFIETPLEDVLEYLRDLHDVLIVLDRKALEDYGIGDSDLSVTATLRDISLRSALGLVLDPMDLTWTIKHDALVITSAEEAEMNSVVKVYDVADLVMCLDQEGGIWADYDSLIDAITPTVAVDTWEDVGGPGVIAGVTLGTANVLIISQNCQVHREIAQLLQQIRGIAQNYPSNGTLPRRSREKPINDAWFRQPIPMIDPIYPFRRDGGSGGSGGKGDQSSEASGNSPQATGTGGGAGYF